MNTPTSVTAVPMPLVRVEDESSMGRSYSAKGNIVKGLGAARRQLSSKTFSVDAPEVSSLTSKWAHLSRATTADVMAYFHNTWNLTDMLFDSFVTDAVFYSLADKLRRRLVFYFAHPAAVYANKCQLAGLCAPINLRLQRMFETGVDEMSWDDMDEMQDEDFEWPTIDVAQDFRMQVKAVLENLICTMPPPCEKPVTQASPYWALFMGFEHERIHLETSSVLMRTFPVQFLKRPAGWKYAPADCKDAEDAPVNELVATVPTSVVMGKPLEFPSFGWDNEYGRKEVDVPAFSASKFLVTNAEYLPFVVSGGYSDKRWWVSPSGDDEGWRWVTYRNAKHPHFWVATSEMPEFVGGKSDLPFQVDDGTAAAGKGTQFRYRAMFDIIDMPWDWPVDVNYLEARAFLNWKGAKDGRVYRMPTEAEHMVMRGFDSSFEASLADPSLDPIMQDEAPGNTNLRYGSSSSVTAFPATSTGFHDVMGNVWEWSEDHFAPLPGFEVHTLYDDFSTPCFDGWHTIILGGSWVSTGDQASKYARYSFRRHFFQHAGFRYVDITGKTEPYPGHPTAANLWESQGRLPADITTDFTESSAVSFPSQPGVFLFKLPEYKSLVSNTIAAAVGETAKQTLLHVGCGVGGTSFELSKSFDLVVGVDKDEPHVRHARVLKHHGQLLYDRVTEGRLVSSEVIEVDPAARRAKVHFVLADACELDAAALPAPQYSVVFLDSLLDRVRGPLNLVKGVIPFVAAGGHLAISCSCDWNPSHTPRNQWLGGFYMNGEPFTTLDMLKHVLGATFELVKTEDVPRVFRQDDRNFSVRFMQVTVWRKL